MIIEEQIYDIEVAKTAQFLQAYEDRGLALLNKHLGSFIGMWTRDVGGSMDQIVQYISYESDQARRAGRTALWGDPEWLAFAGEFGHLIERRETCILVPSRFSPAL
jgi:hypothetical protein